MSATTRVAILDPFSGIAGDMTLGALIAVGLDRAWLEALPATLGLDGVRVRVQEVLRGEIACWKVDFDIPPQPHGRGIREIRQLVAASGAPASVREKADLVFTAIATQEAEIHGMAPEEVHLHEVGAVDAILDVVGSVWGLELLGVERVHCGPIQLGDGFVKAAHGTLPVPAPATLKLLEGLRVRPGPDGAGELVTPTGAGLVRVLSSGPPPAEYVPRRSGFGAGTKDFVGRANALRIVLADVDAEPAVTGESLVLLAADLDDMTGEYLAAAADDLRAAGALDVVVLATHMKKGRVGARLEVLVRPDAAGELERLIFARTTTLGVRSSTVSRRALPREERVADVEGHRVRVKVSSLPDGSSRAKAEFDDVAAAARALGLPAEIVAGRAVQSARPLPPSEVHEY
jgi:pyridinium-3,5-bisthiocarboxylic acid mononucleotide nickel chelatase